MTSGELKNRTKQFAVRIIKLFQALPASDSTRIIGRQLLRSATSVAANYRAACRSRSRTEFLSKIGTVLEEADETLFWLELLSESGVLSNRKLSELVREATELTKIFAAIKRTMRKTEGRGKSEI